MRGGRKGQTFSRQRYNAARRKWRNSRSSFANTVPDNQAGLPRPKKVHSNKFMIVISGDGKPCPRCGHVTQVRAHRIITAKLLRQPYYFSQWYFCINPNCRTTLIMDETYKVMNVPQGGSDREKRPLKRPSSDGG